MKKRLTVVVAALCALVGISAFPVWGEEEVKPCGVLVDGTDLAYVPLYPDQETPSPGVYVMGGYCGGSSEIFIQGPDLSPIEYKISSRAMNGTKVFFDSFITVAVGDADVTLKFTSFNGGMDFFTIKPGFNGQGKLRVIFDGKSVAHYPQEDIFAVFQYEPQKAEIILEEGSGFGFNPTKYLQPSQFALKTTDPDGFNQDGFWVVCAAQGESDKPAIADNALPTGDENKDVDVQVTETITYKANVSRVGPNESPDEDISGNQVFRGTMGDYTDSGVQNVIVISNEDDDSMVTQANDFENGAVYTTITRGGVTRTFCSNIRPPSDDDASAQASTPDHPVPAIPEGAESTASAYRLSPAEESFVRIDMMIAYDTAAKTFAESDCGGITNLALLSVARMNTALANSGLSDKFLFRLVGVECINANGNGDLYTVLSNVTYATSGEWAKVKQLRDVRGADIVSVLVDTGSAYGCTGLGWSLDDTWIGYIPYFKDYAFSVCAVRSVAISDTMTHEVGHNMGAGHADITHMDVDNAGPQFGSSSCGFYFEKDWVNYHTIMAYDMDKNATYYQAAPYFSTPDKAYGGVTVGDASHNNVAALASTYVAVSNFRTAKAPAIDDGSGEGGEGTSGGGEGGNQGGNEGEGTQGGNEGGSSGGNEGGTSGGNGGGESQGGGEKKPEMDPLAITPIAVADIKSGFEVSKAATLGGCLLDANSRPTGTLELKLGKANAKTGLSKVTGTYTPIGGKKVTLKALEKAGVNIRDGVGEVNFAAAKGVDAMSFKIGADMNGKLVFASADGRVTSVDAVNPSGTKGFSVKGVPEVLDGVEINMDYLPTEAHPEPVEMGTKWTCAKAMALAYKKDKTSGEFVWVENNGKAANGKTNCSGLKLTYTAKKGTVKGAFTAYGLQKGKLKKLKFTVTGAVIGGNVYLTAAYKKMSFECSVK